MFDVTIHAQGRRFSLDVSDVRFVNKWGEAYREEVWLFTKDAPEPFQKQMKTVGVTDTYVYVAPKSDLDKVIVR